MSIQKLTAAQLSTNLIKKNILIVGGTAGIGRALAISCLSRGANVSIVGRRSPDEALSAATFIKSDLSLLRNAKNFASSLDHSKIDILVFTNGIISAAKRQVSGEGVELDMAVSYLSRYAIVKSLIDAGKFGTARSDKSRKPRIFVTGYPGQSSKVDLDDFNSEQKYSFTSAHMNTVVANENLVSYIAKSSSIDAFGLNPGLIRTEIRDNYLGKGSWLSWIVENLIGFLTPTPEYYAENTLVHLLANADLQSNTHYSQKGLVLTTLNPFLDDEAVRDRLIKESELLYQRALAAKI